MSLLRLLTYDFPLQTPSVDSGVASHFTSILPSESEGMCVLHTGGYPMWWDSFEALMLMMFAVNQLSTKIGMLILAYHKATFLCV